MKIRLVLILLVLTPALAHAEYTELIALRNASYRAVQEYSERFCNVDPKFEGIVHFGETLKSAKDAIEVNVDQLTVTNKDYWRAVLEMVPTDPSILFAHAHLHVTRGETAYAETYFLLGSLTMQTEFGAELTKYQELKTQLDNTVARNMQIGIQHYDKGEYAKALATYDNVIAQYPNSAWAFYEKGLSYLVMEQDDPQFEKKKEEMHSECRRRDPFFWQAYQGSDQKIIQKLLVLGEKVHPFISGKQQGVESLEAFAEGCEEMELYPFAAHARWKLVQLDAEHMGNHLKKFLDLLPQCGCAEAEFFRQQFNLETDDLAKPPKAPKLSAPDEGSSTPHD